MNLVSLVEQSQVTPTSIEGAWDIYRQWARPLSERKLMKRRLAIAAAKNCIFLENLFALDEAWRVVNYEGYDTNQPTMGLAKFGADRVRYGAHAGTAAFFTGPESFPSHALSWNPSKSVALPNHRQNPYGSAGGDRHILFEAIVPPVPRSVVPFWPKTRRKSFVLFDADWKGLPADPYLMERVGESQFRILAHWDLTEREREIMRLLKL